LAAARNNYRRSIQYLSSPEKAACRGKTVSGDRDPPGHQPPAAVNGSSTRGIKGRHGIKRMTGRKPVNHRYAYPRFQSNGP
jgi:hypothetical protein